MDFYGYHVAPFAKQLAVNVDSASSCRRTYVGAGVLTVGRCACIHEIASYLSSVDISHEAIVSIVCQSIDLVCSRGAVECDGFAEVVGGALLAAVSSIVERCGIVAGAVHSHIAIAEGRVGLLPRCVGVGCRFPVFSVKRTLVVVTPRCIGVEDRAKIADCLCAVAHPSFEAVACRSLGGECHRGIERTVEASCGYFQAVCQECGIADVAAQFQRIATVVVQTEVFAEIRHARISVVGAVDGILKIVSRSVHAAFFAIERHGFAGAVLQGCEHLADATGFKHASVHKAETVDEAFFECLVLQHVQENVNDEVLARVIAAVVERVGKILDHARRDESLVLIHEYQVVLTVLTRTVALDVVAVGGPVVASRVTFDSHVVAIFVDVDDLADLLVESVVGWVVGQLLGKRHPTAEYDVVARLLLVAL